MVRIRDYKSLLQPGKKRVSVYKGMSNMDVAPEPYRDVLAGVPIKQMPVPGLVDSSVSDESQSRAKARSHSGHRSHMQ